MPQKTDSADILNGAWMKLTISVFPEHDPRDSWRRTKKPHTKRSRTTTLVCTTHRTIKMFRRWPTVRFHEASKRVSFGRRTKRNWWIFGVSLKFPQMIARTRERRKKGIEVDSKDILTTTYIGNPLKLRR